MYRLLRVQDELVGRHDGKSACSRFDQAAVAIDEHAHGAFFERSSRWSWLRLYAR
jgi:hypothetical protein